MNLMRISVRIRSYILGNVLTFCPYQFAVKNGNGNGVLHFTVAGPDQTPGVSLVASQQLDDYMYTIIRLSHLNH